MVKHGFDFPVIDDEGVISQWLPVANLGGLEKAVDRFNRTAKSMGFDPSRFKIGETVELDGGWMSWVELEIKEIKLEGDYQFLGTIEFHSQGNLIRTAPGQVIPEEFKTTSACRCDHCKVQVKARLKAIILLDGNGEFLQIGSNCAAKFLGVSLEAALKYWTSIQEVFSKTGSGSSKHRSTDEILAYTSAIVKRYGWKSKSSCRSYGDVPTASIVHDHLFKPGMVKADDYRFPVKLSEADWAKAREVRENWDSRFKGQNTDYVYNVGILLYEDLVDASKNLSYVVSSLPTYEKKLTEIKKAEVEPTEYFGELGASYRTELTVTSLMPVAGAWGSRILASFVTGEGHVVKTFMTNVTAESLYEGWRVNATFTVSEQKVWRGKKETIVKKLKVVPPLRV